MHESMNRLYSVARAQEGITRPSEMAIALNESQQTITNWEVRGISKDGALKAQKRFGVDANWLLIHGPAEQLPAHHVVREEAPPYVTKTQQWLWPFERVTPDQYKALTDKERAHIEDGILLCIEGRTEKKTTPAQEIRPQAKSA